MFFYGQIKILLPFTNKQINQKYVHGMATAKNDIFN